MVYIEERRERASEIAATSKLAPGAPGFRRSELYEERERKALARRRPHRTTTGAT